MFLNAFEMLMSSKLILGKSVLLVIRMFILYVRQEYMFKTCKDTSS